MPTYEYSCKSCGEHLEVVQSFKDDALTQCPNCGGVLKKVFGNIGIVFKGSGFYKNDSRSGHSSSKTASVGSSAASEAASVASSEATKPAVADGSVPSKPAASTSPASSTGSSSSSSSSSAAAAS